MFDALRNYNREMIKLRQYDPDSYPDYVDFHDGDNSAEVLIQALGMTNDQENLLTGALTNELKSYIAKKKNIPFVQVELKMTHVKAVEVDYDYLTELLSKFMNSVHNHE
jgi:type I restriction enzyme R subunit